MSSESAKSDTAVFLNFGEELVSRTRESRERQAKTDKEQTAALWKVICKAARIAADAQKSYYRHRAFLPTERRLFPHIKALADAEKVFVRTETDSNNNPVWVFYWLNSSEIEDE